MDISTRKCNERNKDNIDKLACTYILWCKNDITIQTDWSQSGTGSFCLQNGHIIGYSSVSLTYARKRYAQIEKELPSIVHACKFSQYILNKDVTVITDHRHLFSFRFYVKRK